MSTDSFSDFVVGHGELWCAQLLSHALQQAGLDAAFMDTREVLVVSPASDGTTVDVEYAESNAKLDAWAHTNGSPQVGGSSPRAHVVDAFQLESTVAAVCSRQGCWQRLSLCV